MKHSKQLTRTFSSALVALCVSAMAFNLEGCTRNDASNKSAAKTTAANSTSVNNDAAGTKLGDLTPFSSIAVDVNQLVAQGNLPQAKTRIKDLEIAWDAAEAGLKPRSADEWHTLDKAIDKALTTLRADTPNQADCKAAMTGLLDTFKRLQAPKK